MTIAANKGETMQRLELFNNHITKVGASYLAGKFAYIGLASNPITEETSKKSLEAHSLIIPSGETAKASSPIIFSHKIGSSDSPQQLTQENVMLDSPPKKIAKKLVSLSQTSNNPKDLLDTIRFFLSLADTPEHQQTCLSEIDACITQSQSKPPIINQIE